jgi:hypothetical protein
MWIRLRVNKAIVRKGAITQYKKGDWVNIGRQTAEQWILGGEAETVDPAALSDGIQATSGIAVRGLLTAEWRKRFEDISGLQLAFYENGWTYELPFTETLIWKPGFDLRLDLLLKGFQLLKTWQVVVPLFDYTTLAANVGTVSDRQATKAVIRDLRVPLRDTRLIYLRRCDATRELVNTWRDVAHECKEERLAFLQALYMVKPLVCDVPCSWTGKS